HLGAGGLPQQGLPPGQISAALCYANDVTVEDPFDEEQILGDFITDMQKSMPQVSVQIAPDPAQFVSTVRELAKLAPLVRAGHITFVPRRLAMDSRMVGAFCSNASDTFKAQREELALRSLRLWLASGGVITPLFGNDDDEAAFREQAGLLEPLTQTTESMRLQRVSRLTLPVAVRLDPQQMVRVREDDTFESFRTTQRRALASIQDGSDTELADYRAEMAQAARDLDWTVSNRTSLSSLFTRALGWSVGAMILAPDTWVAAVAALSGISAEAAAEHFLTRERALHQALRHHFITLAESG
ncbi:MAG: hypothetical protein Q4B08_10990, partial [Propionibacteriaceae bacterium]|nr:hypothetical protein [Propionibacteriaceae bacterium]